jgi:hypothetical protein
MAPITMTMRTIVRSARRWRAIVSAPAAENKIAACDR